MQLRKRQESKSRDQKKCSWNRREDPGVAAQEAGYALHPSAAGKEREIPTQVQVQVQTGGPSHKNIYRSGRQGMWEIFNSCLGTILLSPQLNGNI